MTRERSGTLGADGTKSAQPTGWPGALLGCGTGPSSKTDPNPTDWRTGSRHVRRSLHLRGHPHAARQAASNGALHEVKPLDLVVGLIDELRTRNPDLDENLISDVILGVVSPVGDQGGDIARTAVLAAGLPDTVGGVQLNRFCASGLEAVNTAAQKVRSGWDDLVLAGGVESMSRVPMGSDGGAWALDPATNYDSYFVPQGIGADLIATIEGFSREDVDAYALRSRSSRRPRPGRAATSPSPWCRSATRTAC